MALKDRLKAARQDMGLTLDEVAQKVGVSRQTIQRYESGVISNIPSDNIERLAATLNTTPADLMGWNTGGPLVSTTVTFTPDSPLHALTQAYLRRPKAVQDEIIRRLEGLDTTFSQNVSKLLAVSKDYNGFMEHTKLSQQAFASLLTGAPAQITPEEAESIAAFFGADVVDLFFDYGGKAPTEPAKIQTKEPEPPTRPELEQPPQLSKHCRAIYRYIKQKAKKDVWKLIRINDYKKLLQDERVSEFIEDTINAIEETQSAAINGFDPRIAYKVIANEIIRNDFVETYVDGGDAGMDDLIDTILNNE